MLARHPLDVIRRQLVLLDPLLFYQVQLSIMQAYLEQ